MLAEADKFLGGLYSMFITRDLTYIVSGGLVIGIAGIPFISIDLMASTIPWYILLIYAACSYILGLLLQETAVFFKIMQMEPKQIESDGSTKKINYIILMDDIHQKCHPQTILKLERYIYLKHFGATVGTALLFTGMILAFYFFFDVFALSWWQLILTEISIALFFVVCRRLNQNMIRLQLETIEQLNDRIGSSQTDERTIPK